jgi:hypothetical protein
VPWTSKYPVLSGRKHQVSFLERHHVTVTDRHKTEHFDVAPRFRFVTADDYLSFQRLVRERLLIRTFETISILGILPRRHSKSLSVEQHVKIWKRSKQDEKPTVSFSAIDFLSGSPCLKHYEFFLREFRRDVSISGAKVRLKFNRPQEVEPSPGDGLQSLQPRCPFSNGFPFPISFKRYSRDMSSPASPAVSSGTRLSISGPSSPDPEKLLYPSMLHPIIPEETYPEMSEWYQQLGGIDINFESAEG